MIEKAMSKPEAASAVSTGGAADAPIEISSSPKAATSTKLTEESATVNGSPEVQELSPNAKKRAHPENTSEEEPTTKKSKESSTPSTPHKETSPVRERFPSPPDEAATALDKEKWQGYCEIESEPAYFSVVLREIGVRGITVREVPFLDPETLSYLPNPIYGLILLFRHRQFDLDSQEKTCPSNVWFANQMPGQNSCATLAMIHALLNMQPTADVDIGEHMRQFKDFTNDFKPLQRGEAFASWEFVKRIHNSFAKKMDMLENDKYIAYKASKANKDAAKAKQEKAIQKGRRHSADSNATDDSAENFEENAHHYIAFVPINGEVWKLDGMDAQPTRMGTYDVEKGESWLDAISDRIMALMAAGDDDYGVFAIAQSPLVELRREICQADNTIKHVHRRLDAISTDWKSFVPEEDREPPSPSWLEGFSDEQRALHPVPDDVASEIDEEGMPSLLSRRAELVSEIRRLAVLYAAEEGQEAEENDAAEARRWDYGPAIKKWLEMLAENGWLEENLHLFPLQK